jgi:hypothetical protein
MTHALVYRPSDKADDDVADNSRKNGDIPARVQFVLNSERDRNPNEDCHGPDVHDWRSSLGTPHTPVENNKNNKCGQSTISAAAASERKDRMIGVPGWLRFGAAAIALAAASYGAAPARAADIIADWPTIQMPPPPALKPATRRPPRFSSSTS